MQYSHIQGNPCPNNFQNHYFIREPKINNWDKISHEAYKFMFDQAKARFEEIISESEVITERSIKLLTILVGFFLALIGLSVKTPPQSELTWVIGIRLCWILYCSFG